MDSTGLETEGVLLVLPGVRNALQQPLEVEIGGLLSVQDGFDDVGGEEGKVEDAGDVTLGQALLGPCQTKSA